MEIEKNALFGYKGLNAHTVQPVSNSLGFDSNARSTVSFQHLGAFETTEC